MAGIYDSLVRDSLQKGTMISLPFRSGYIVVLCILGGISLQRYSGADLFWIL